MNHEDLRDFFAGLAMLGLLISDDFRGEEEPIDETAYKLADAMITIRNETKGRSEE